MLSSEIWFRVRLVKTDVSEERVASIFRPERIRSEEQRQQPDSRQLADKTYTAPFPKEFFIFTAMKTSNLKDQSYVVTLEYPARDIQIQCHICYCIPDDIRWLGELRSS
jgi:hypothetical protein